MKAILLIDEMPGICYKCPCYDHEGGICQASNSWKTDRENGCPLKPLPEAKEIKPIPKGQTHYQWLKNKHEIIGWNNYLKEIEK